MRFLCVALALVVWGCESEGDDGDAGGAGAAGGQGGQGGGLDAGMGGAGGTGGEGGMGGTPDPDVGFTIPDASPHECPEGARNVHTVVGQIQDNSGAPVVTGKAQICIRLFSSRELICLRPADSNGEGDFYIRVAEMARCAESAVMRVLKPNEDMATTYCQLEILNDGQVDLEAPITLFATTPPTDRPDMGDGLGPKTVVFADGLALDLIPDDLYTGGDPGYENLNVAIVDPSDQRLCGNERPEFDALYAFSPEADIDNNPAPARIPTALVEGTEVALYVLGGLNCTLADGSLVEEGEWVEFTRATVGAGGVVDLAGMNGLPCLGWLGYHAI